MPNYTKMTETLLISYANTIWKSCQLLSDFGTASSPFMLHATIYLHLHKFQLCASEDIQRNIYVDNIISGCDTETELVQYYTQTQNIINKTN